jgi:hypothetical protein
MRLNGVRRNNEEGLVPRVRKGRLKSCILRREDLKK